MLLPFLLISFSSYSQSYTSYRTGSFTDTTTQALGGICLMGGGTENDRAMQWLLKRAAGGDAVVLRASGADGYNNYFFTELGVALHSVETLVFHSPEAANEPYVLQRIAEAELIWFAGGDQSDYVSYWRNTEVQVAINLAVQQRKVAIGGTSAGMAILGRYYFSASGGTVTSAEALNTPTAALADTTAFLQIPYLQNVITDTHYDNPDRRGRQVVWLANLFEQDTEIKGIAAEEFTAVCIAPDGRASVFGNYPEYDDYAYFITSPCAAPEQLHTDQPLHWEQQQRALQVYKVPGSTAGANYFELSNWQEGFGGEWQHWWVEHGTLQNKSGSLLPCGPLSTDLIQEHRLKSLGNSRYVLEMQQRVLWWQLTNLQGLKLQQQPSSSFGLIIDLATEAAGVYLLQVQTETGISTFKLMKK